MIKNINKYLSYKKNFLYFEEVLLKNIGEKFKTPIFCYSLSEIEDNFNSLKRSFKIIKPLICYAVKANSNKHILSFLAKKGSGADVVSDGELKKSIDNGIMPEKIVFSGVGKTENEIKYALKKKIKQINVESEEELNEISEIAESQSQKVNICIRVNPDIDAKTHYKISTGKSEDKFGIPNSRVVKLFDKFSNNKFININGLSIHIGSQINSIKPFKKAFEKIKKQVISLRKLGHTLEVLDLGGGIGIRYSENDKIINLKEYGRLIENFFSEMELEIIIEPGRSLVGSSGILLSKVIRNKTGENKNFIILDAGMNNLVRPAMYDAEHKIYPVQKKKTKLKQYDFVGPICETSDIFSKNISVQKLDKNDFVVICSTGAYGSCMASDYNLRGMAKEIIVKKKKNY